MFQEKGNQSSITNNAWKKVPFKLGILSDVFTALLKRWSGKVVSNPSVVTGRKTA